MLPLSENSQVNSIYLLALFKDDLKKKLTAEALSAIKPAVEEAVKDVIAELDMQITQHYDALRDQVVVNFLQKGSAG